MYTKAVINNARKDVADAAARSLRAVGIDFEYVPVMLASSAGQSEPAYSIYVKEKDYTKALKSINHPSYAEPNMASAARLSSSTSTSSNKGSHSKIERRFYIIFGILGLILLFGIISVFLDDGTESTGNKTSNVVEDSSSINNPKRSHSSWSDPFTVLPLEYTLPEIPDLTVPVIVDPVRSLPTVEPVLPSMPEMPPLPDTHIPDAVLRARSMNADTVNRHLANPVPEKGSPSDDPQNNNSMNQDPLEPTVSPELPLEDN